jgi:hypothetical protein
MMKMFMRTLTSNQLFGKASEQVLSILDELLRLVFFLIL